MTITRLSTRGQLVIPKEVRDRHGWGPGTQLEVVDLVGCTGHEGPPRSDAEIRTALDTNIQVGLVTNDDPTQAAAAVEALRGQASWVSRTVVLETAPAVRRALAWHRNGMDLADALHLAATPPGARFTTFDQGLARRAAALDDAPAVQRLG